MKMTQKEALAIARQEVGKLYRTGDGWAYDTYDLARNITFTGKSFNCYRLARAWREMSIYEHALRAAFPTEPGLWLDPFSAVPVFKQFREIWKSCA